MRNNLVHRISALTLSALMLCVSMGFTVDMHYCGGEMLAFSVFGNADSCTSMESKSTATWSDHQDNNIGSGALKMQRCCEDRLSYVQPMENLNTSAQTQIVDQIQISYNVIPVHDSKSNSLFYDRISTNMHYRPPVLLRATTVVLQSFLI
jgi:hypothetical protein